MKVLISGGGTAGHINPAIAIGTRLKKEGAEVLYIGSNGSLEKKLYSQTGCPFRQFPSCGLDRKNLLNNPKILYTDWKAYRNILKVVSEFQPDVGVSTGGYISALSMLALKKLHVPFLIHEQNAYPGLTSKLLSRWAKKYAVAFPDVKCFFRYPDRTVLTGNPIRSEFLSTDRAKARQALGLSEEEPVILCFGGSLGALKLNDAFAGIVPMAQKDGITLLIGTGSRYHKQFMENVKYLSYDRNKIRIYQYIDDMPTALTACDLAITRAGAMTVSELCAIKKPSVLVPSPNVTANHQDKNAQALSDIGGAVKLQEQDLNAQTLYGIIESLVNNPTKLKTMSENLESLSITDGDIRIADLVKEIAASK